MEKKQEEKSNFLQKSINLYRECKKSETNFLYLICSNLYFRIRYKKNIYLHQNAYIRGIKNIEQSGKLSIGTGYYIFMHKTDKTLLNITGKLILKGEYTIGRGCRFFIGECGSITIGKDGYVSPNTTFIIMHQLVIGEKCYIAWDCQFLDEDFHEIKYQGKKETDNSITIGDNVWIGCGVKIYKGTIIPDNCVIAADSVVKGIFTERNSLIAGNPAKVIKKDVEWF